MHEWMQSFHPPSLPAAVGPLSALFCYVFSHSILLALVHSIRTLPSLIYQPSFDNFTGKTSPDININISNNIATAWVFSTPYA